MAPPFAHFLAQHDEFHDFAWLVSNSFGRDAPRLIYMIKSDDKGRAAKAEWRGAAVIVKEIYAADRRQTIADLEVAHARLRLLFPHGPLKFPGALATCPTEGLVITPFAPGLRLDEAMRQAHADQRLDILRSAIAWLVRSMAGRRENGQFWPEYWIGRLQTAVSEATLRPEDADLAAQVLTRLQALAPSLRGGPVPRGPLHGDFSSQNMVWDAATGDLSVFDLQQLWVAPVAIDLGSLLGDLTYKALRDQPRTPLDRGLAADLRATVMRVPGLDHPDDPGGFMDFMMGQRHVSVLLGKLDHPLGPHVRRATRHWLCRVPGP